MQVQESRQRVESVAGSGSQLFETVKNLIHEGNVRRMTIKQDGDTIAEFPLTIGVLGAALAPPLAAIGAIAALVLWPVHDRGRTRRRPTSGYRKLGPPQPAGCCPSRFSEGNIR
jgi:hypothetical protein